MCYDNFLVVLVLVVVSSVYHKLMLRFLSLVGQTLIIGVKQFGESHVGVMFHWNA